MEQEYMSLGNIARNTYAHVKQHGITKNNLKNIGRGVIQKLPGQLYSNLRATGSVGKPVSLKGLAMNEEMKQLTNLPASRPSFLKGLSAIKAPAPKKLLLARASHIATPKHRMNTYMGNSSPRAPTPLVNSNAEDPAPLLQGGRGRRTRKAKARARRYTKRR